MTLTKTITDRAKNSRFLKDSFWALFGNVANKGLALLAGILIARYLGVETYGEYGMIRTTLLYIAVFSTFGLGFTVTKFTAQAEGNDKIRTIVRAAMTISLVFSGVMALAVIVFAHPLAVFLEAPETDFTLRLTAVTIVFNSLVTVQNGVLAGLKQFRKNAEINIVSGIVTFVATVGLTYSYELNGAVMALLIANVVNSLLNQAVIHRLTRGGQESSVPIIGMMRQQLRFSTPIAVQELAFSLSFWVGNLLLIKLSNYSELGLRAAASQWAAAVLFIPGVLQNVILSYLSKNSEESVSHDTMLKRMLLINFSAAFVPFLVVLIGSPLIVSFYGPNFDGLLLVLNIAVATTVVNCLVQVYIQEYIAQGHTWALCLIRLGRDILCLMIAYIAIKELQQYAAACYTAAYMFASILCLISLALFHNRFKAQI